MTEQLHRLDCRNRVSTDATVHGSRNANIIQAQTHRELQKTVVLNLPARQHDQNSPHRDWD